MLRRHRFLLILKSKRNQYHQIEPGREQGLAQVPIPPAHPTHLDTKERTVEGDIPLLLGDHPLENIEGGAIHLTEAALGPTPEAYLEDKLHRDLIDMIDLPDLLTVAATAVILTDTHLKEAIHHPHNIGAYLTRPPRPPQPIKYQRYLQHGLLKIHQESHLLQLVLTLTQKKGLHSWNHMRRIKIHL